MVAKKTNTDSQAKYRRYQNEKNINQKNKQTTIKIIYRRHTFIVSDLKHDASAGISCN